MSKIMGFLKYISVYKIFSLGESWGMGERFQNVSKNFLENYICCLWFNTYTSNIFPEIWGEYFWKNWNLQICSQEIIFCCNTHDRNCQTIFHSKTYITISNLLLQVIIILFDIFSSFFPNEILLVIFFAKWVLRFILTVEFQFYF